MAQVMRNKPTPSTAFWGPISLGLPIVWFVVAFLFVIVVNESDRASATPSMASLGAFIYALFGSGFVGFFGAAAAIRAIMKKEKWIAMSVISLLLNLAFIVVGCWTGSTLFQARR
jgi:S-formylglutathione hydrolase FrmB